MEQSLEPSLDRPFPPVTDHHDESTSEYNTAELSDLSGLSKVLRADDSIADRVRCLLENDDGSENSEKPALLSSTNGNVPANDEIKAKIESLLQDVEGDAHERMMISEEAEKNASAKVVQEEPTIEGRETTEDNTGDVKPEENEAEHRTPEVSANGRPSGDGAACDPSPVMAVDSSDDIMNISDSTEYSDLPKVVDNPIKSVSQPLISSDEKKSSHSFAAHSGSVEKPLSNIKAKTRLYADSDPNIHSPDDVDQMHDLEKYVSKRDNHGPSSLGEAKETPVDINRRTAMGPIHSTPYVPQPGAAYQNPRTLQPSISARPTVGDDRRCSREANITMRSSSSRNSGAEIAYGASRRASPGHLQDIPKELDDEELLKKVRKVVNNGAEKSSALKGPHTASEQSIASTVDSLAMHVKNLLREEEPASRHSFASNPSDVNLIDASHASNYSEELSNFEKTSLWKYARQFLPGAMTPSRDIQPLAKFCKPSPIQAKEITSDSSDISSPETYRLTKQAIGPHRELRQKSPLPSVSSNLSKEDFRHQPVPVERDISRSQIHSRTSDTSATRNQSFVSRREASSFLSKSSSGIIGRYDSYTKPTSYTPQNESYKPLEPEYSQTPFTPYSFVTPTKVAWEPEKNPAVVKHRSPYPRERAADSIPPRSTPTRDISFSRAEPAGMSSLPEERSAYFSQALQLDVERSPKPQERSPNIRFQRLPSDHIDAMRKRYTDRNIEEPNRKERSTISSEDHIFVKPVTPPAVSRQEIPRLDRSKTWHREMDEHGPNPTRLSPRSSPKSVHFGETTPHRSQPNARAVPQASNSFTYRQNSFTTPMLSARPPQRSTTPKVMKEKSRPAKSLPTYDQLIAEEKRKQIQVQAQQENSFPEKNEVSFDEAARSTPVQKHKDVLMSDEAEFAPLRPQICLDESFEEDPGARATARMINKERSYRLDLSDNDLHRRTTLSRDSCGSGTDSPEIQSEVDSSPDAEKYSSEEKRASEPTPPSSPAEPAPLPFVRLCKKKPTMLQKSKTPPLRSISTEKVQNLLMKEKSVKGRQPARNLTQDTSSSLPATNGGYSSSDDDLLNLLETFSTKVPLMEKLLRKLYEKNVAKKSRLLDHMDETVNDENERSPVDRSAQTSNPKQPALVRSRCEDVPCSNPSDRRKLFAENSCQTSFVKRQRKPRVAHKSTSPMRDYTTETDEISDADDTEENYDVSVCSVVEGKENSFGSKLPACAFFVDLTPEKLRKSEEKPGNQPKPPPVAWYEPYEYTPPWKPKERVPRTTLGFVDANIQDAFLNKKRDFVIRSWERQEDIAIRAEERKLKDLEEKIHDQIEALHKEKATKSAQTTSIVAPPKTKQKKDRMFGWKEMRMASKRKYEFLPEVVEKKKDAERKKHYEINRKRAEIYKRKITQLVVRKQRGKLASEVR